MQTKTIVITGLGIISSIGKNKQDFWNNLINGKSGISEISSYDTSVYSCHYGGEIKDFDPLIFFKDKNLFKGNASAFGLAATITALEDARLDINYIDKSRVAILLGTTSAESIAVERINDHIHQSGNISQFDTSWKRLLNPASIPALIAAYLGIEGCAELICTACAAGNYAIIEGMNRILKNDYDIIIAGGTEAFSINAFAGFHRLGSMAEDKVRPFSKNRKGIMVGEGAGIVILESEAHAKARGAHIYAKLLGYGVSCDAYHITGADDNGEGISFCMEKCIKSSGIKPSNIDYISAHGTGTPRNDEIETKAIKKVFKDEAYNIPISSIKSMIGHCMGAASAIEAVASCLILENQILPPTINYEEPDPVCDLDYIPNIKRKADVKTIMSNAYGFGGNNASICLEKYKN